eukprot:2699736-Amphidinium_carterae.1
MLQQAASKTHTGYKLAPQFNDRVRLLQLAASSTSLKGYGQNLLHLVLTDASTTKAVSVIIGLQCSCAEHQD